MPNCLFCDKPCSAKFCNNSCSAKFNNAKRATRSEESRKKTSDSMNGKSLPEETRLKISESLLGRPNTWSVSHSEETRLKLSAVNVGKVLSEETKRKLSKIAKQNQFGGHTSKRKLYFQKKNGEVVYLQSSYEIKFAELLEELHIEWSRPEPLMWIDELGIDHRYYPDFKIGNIYVDTKNDYLAVEDLPKIIAVREQNDVDIRIVTLNQITKEFITSLAQE